MQNEIPAIDTFWQQLYSASQSQKIDEQAITSVQLNNDLTQFTSINSSQERWVASPAAGVVRILLERDGGEKTTRATSLVAYQANSQFSSHNHPKGEEFFVLAGTFSDENGDYPAGTYVRNPPGSSHKPFSKNGCLIFVKLQQFLDGDLEHVVSTVDLSTQGSDILFDGSESGNEIVSIYKANKKKSLPDSLIKNGAEILVLSGAISKGSVCYDVGSWLRLPVGSSSTIDIHDNSALLIKIDHLRIKR